MNSVLKTLAFATILITIPGGCSKKTTDPSPENPAPINVVHDSTYTNNQIKLTLTAPSSHWTLKTDQVIQGTNVPLLGTRNDTGSYITNFNLIYSTHSGDTSLINVLNQFESFYSGTYIGYTTLSKQVITGPNLTYGEMDYQITLSSINLTQKLIIFIHNNWDIQITFTSSRNEYSSVENEFDRIVC